MRSTRVIALVLLAVPAHAFAAGSGVGWKGQNVMPKLGATAKVGNQTVDEKMFGLPWTVQQTSGPSLWVGDHHKGWVRQSDVVRLDDAPAYYSECIKSQRSVAWSYYLRGCVWPAKDQFDAAIADFSDAIRIDPLCPGVRQARDRVGRQTRA